MAKAPVFLREATGLVKSIGPFDALVFAIGAVIGPVWVPILIAEWSLYPGISIPASFIITAIFGSLWGLYYVVVTGLFSRSGGGSYIPLSRTIHPILGMAMSFSYTVALMLTLGFVASIMMPVAVASPLLTYGIVTGNIGLQNLASALSTPTWTVIGGMAFLLLAALAATVGRRITLLANKITFILGTLGFIIVLAIFATTPQSQFQTAFNNFAGSQNAYQNITATAHSSGFNPSVNWVTPTILSLPFSFFAVLGFQAPAFFSGEIRRLNRSMILAVVGGIFYGCIMYALVAWLIQNSLGSDFVSSAAYLFNSQPAKYTISVPPYANTLLIMINPNPIVTLLVLLSIISFGYLFLVTVFYMCSRFFLAWSFDRAFPSALGRVSDRFHTPVISVSIAFLIAFVAFLVFSLFPATSGFVSLSFVIIAAESLDGLGGIALPYFRKSIFESAPPFVKKKVAGIPLVALLGGYTFIVMVIMFIIALSNPLLIGPFNLATGGLIVFSLIIGAAIYLGMHAYHSSRGLNISLAFKEIPPE